MNSSVAHCCSKLQHESVITSQILFGVIHPKPPPPSLSSCLLLNVFILNIPLLIPLLLLLLIVDGAVSFMPALPCSSHCVLGRGVWSFGALSTALQARVVLHNPDGNPNTISFHIINTGLVGLAQCQETVTG